MRADSARALLRSPRRLLFLMAALAALAVVGAGYVVMNRGGTSRQEEVAARGALVMPFDLTRTTHTFRDEANGGRETVLANDPSDTTQIALIRSHLQKVAQQFSRGDFSDPTTIHGNNMPGVRELSAGAGRITFNYADLSSGGAITYTSSDPVLVAAIHDWFAAQRGDHGSHSMAP